MSLQLHRVLIDAFIPTVLYDFSVFVSIEPLGFLSGGGMWLAIIGPIAITAQTFISYLNTVPSSSGNIPVMIDVGRDKKNIHALMEEWPSDRY